MADTRPIADPPKRVKLGGRYVLGAPISSGAMGAVYRGRDDRSGDKVAIKRLLDVRHAARFVAEARLLAQLRHPRVVRVIDHVQDETGMYLVMQLVKGKDLRRLLDAKGDPGLPPAQAVEYTRQTCEALQYVHDQQVIHRDVKPENLILADDGVVLVDFGIAKEVDTEDSGTTGVGTPPYIAPEVLSGGAVSPQSDVFSLGATLWTLIVGSPPMYGSRSHLMSQLTHLDEHLKEALCAGLELSPDDRIASPEAFAEALGSPLERTTGVSLAMSVSSPSASPALLESVVRTAAGVFDAASASIALIQADKQLVYEASWGAGAREIVGVKLARGVGIAGSVVEKGHGLVVPECKQDPRFAVQVAAGTGYVPNTMLVVPLKRDGQVVGVLSVLDKRDGGAYGADDVVRAGLFADLAVATLESQPTRPQDAGLADQQTPTTHL